MLAPWWYESRHDQRPAVALISFGPRDSTGWLARALAPHAAVELVVPDAMADYIRTEVGDGVRILEFDWPRSSHPVGQLRRSPAQAGLPERAYT
jgi:hypothetical protein